MFCHEHSTRLRKNDLHLIFSDFAPETMGQGNRTSNVFFRTLLILSALLPCTQAAYPLPGPAFGKHANPVPPGVLDWKPRPLQGPLAPNTRLRAAVRLFDGLIKGAESVVVGPEGQLVMLDRYSHLWEARQDGKTGQWVLSPEPLAKLGPGRPLGYDFTDDGNLIVCDSLKGLLKYDYSTGDVTLLATHVSSSSHIDPGSTITYANDLAIARDGSIYFTSCTDIIPPLNAMGFWDTYRAWFLGLMQALPKGRLLKYDPKTKEAHVIAKGFYYANGVALSPDESFVVMAETDAIRAHKIWVKGPKAGQAEVLIDRLPGMPDGVDASPTGGYWISLVAPAPPFKSLLLQTGLRSPLVRALVAWLPPKLRPGLKAWGAVVKVDDDGQVVDFLQDPDGTHVATVSAVSEEVIDAVGGTRLWLGNLVGSYVSYVDLGSAAAAGGGGVGGGGEGAGKGGCDEL